MENKAALEKKIKLKKLHISITNTVMQQKKKQNQNAIFNRKIPVAKSGI